MSMVSWFCFLLLLSVVYAVDDRARSPVKQITTCPSWPSCSEIKTDLNYNYNNFKVGDVSKVNSKVFTVLATNDAHIALGNTANPHTGNAPLWEIVLGGWGNGKSVIRTKRQGAEVVASNGNIHDGRNAKPVWVSWSDEFLRVGFGNSVGSNEFMKAPLKLQQDLKITNMHVSTGWGSRGVWRFGACVEEDVVSSLNLHKNLAGTKCVESCDKGEFFNWDGQQCVARCNARETLNAKGTQCVYACSKNEVKNSKGTQCVSSCSDKEFLNLKGDQCVSSCSKGELLNLSGAQCVTSCQSPLFKNLQGTRCSNSCNLKEFLNLKGDQCVSSCVKGEILNLAGTKCVNSCVQPACTELKTDRNYNYNSNFVGDVSRVTSKVFSVLATNDAHIGLGASQNPHTGNPAFWEIALGGWSNSKSVIRTARGSAEVATFHGNLHDGRFFKPFWVSWSDEYIRVGTGNVVGANQIMKAPKSSDNALREPIRFMHVTTGWGSNGIWRFGGCVASDSSTEFSNLKGTQCVSSCDKGQFINWNAQQCVSVCDKGQVKSLNGTQCIYNCPKGQVKDLKGIQCIDKCVDKTVLNSKGNQCIAVCPKGEFLNTAGTQCTSSCSGWPTSSDRCNEVYSNDVYSYKERLLGDVSGTDFKIFSVRANNDAHFLIGEDQNPSIDSAGWEVVLGGWANTRSVIRSKQRGTEVAVFNAKILDGTRQKKFWVSWSGDSLRVGTGYVVGEGTILQASKSKNYMDSLKIKFMHVSTGWGASGVWRHACSEMITDTNYHYNGRLVDDISGAKSKVFTVLATNDAHITIGANAVAGDSVWEIVLGGWGNGKSVIRSSRAGKEVASVNGKFHDGKNAKPFWISWSDEFIRVGTGNSAGFNEFMKAPKTSNPNMQIQFMHFSTGWGSNGVWKHGSCVEVQSTSVEKETLNVNGTQCVASCASGQFTNWNGQQCVSTCDKKEILSLNSTQCVFGCPLSQFKNLNGTQCVKSCAAGEFIKNGRCVSSCEKGDFWSEDKSRCFKKCPINQLASSLSGVDGFPRCVSSCPSSQKLINADNSLCVTKCRKSEFESSDGLRCLRTCPSGEATSNGKCLSSCPDSDVMVRVGSIYSCKKVCPSKFKYNFHGNRCTKSCGYREFLSVDGVQCVKHCKADAFINSSNSACVKSCPANEKIDRQEAGFTRCIR